MGYIARLNPVGQTRAQQFPIGHLGGAAPPPVCGCLVNGIAEDPVLAANGVLARFGLQDLLPSVVAERVGQGLHRPVAAAAGRAGGCLGTRVQHAGTLSHTGAGHHGPRRDLTREIVVSMLMGPVAFVFPSVDEWVSAVRIRINIVQAARKTMLAFHTSEAERPQDYWTYDEDRGFATREGVSLIQALEMATQPDLSGSVYAFSCYRASEYIILLGIAQELARCNPPPVRAVASPVDPPPDPSPASSTTCFCMSRVPWRHPCRLAILCRGTAPGFAIRMRRRPTRLVLKARG